MLLQHCWSVMSSKIYAKPLSIVGNEYEMVITSLINPPLTIKLVFQKHGVLLPNNQESLQSATSPFEIHANCMKNREIFMGGLHQRLIIVVVDTSTIRCQHLRINFNDIVTSFDNPGVSGSKMTYIPFVSDTESCWFMVALCAISFSRISLDFLLYDAPTFSGFGGSPRERLGLFRLLRPDYLQNPHVSSLWTNDDVLGISFKQEVSIWSLVIAASVDLI